MSLRVRPGVWRVETDYGEVLLDERNGTYWRANPAAQLVLQTIAATGSAADAVHRLRERYDLDPETARRDVAAVVDGLTTAGLVCDG